MRNLVISGYYGSKNAGDEAMLAAMIEVISDLDPQLHITVISANPTDTAERHGVDSISWLDLRSICATIKKADLLISGGGSLLQNVTSGRSLYYYMGIIFLAKMLGTPFMLYAQGIGPVYGKVARWCMGWIGNHAARITVRDKGSLEELAGLGIKKPPIEVTADPVLAIHPVGKEAGREILKKYGTVGASPLVGISVRNWRGWKPYKKEIARVSDNLVREFGARVVFLPMQYPEDVHAAEEVAAFAEEKCTILKDEYSTAEHLSLVGNLDLLIGVRLHALIFAGVMGVPMIGISYDPKVDRFLDSIGETSVGKLETLGGEVLLSAVREKWEQKESFRGKNAELFKELRRLAARNAELAVEDSRKK